MSDRTRNASRVHEPPRGVIARLLALPFKLFGMLCGSLLLAILIECVGMHWFWPEDGWHHAQRTLSFELAQLSSQFTRSLLIENPAQAAEHCVGEAFTILFVRSGLLENASTLSERARTQGAQTSTWGAFPATLAQHVEPHARAGAYTALTFLVRLLVLTLSLPLLALSAFVGFVDGLVRRDLRRYTAAHESGYVHHRARAMIAPLVALPWVVYLAMPVSVQPLLILLPSAACLGVAVQVATRSFKKYL